MKHLLFLVYFNAIVLLGLIVLQKAVILFGSSL